MKRNWIIALSMAGVLSVSSCGDKFLEKQPKGRYSPESLQNATGVEGLLVGAYGALDGIPVGAGQSDWHGSIHAWIFGDVVSDDAYKGTDAGDQPEQTFLETYQWLETNNHVRGKWSAMYNGVARTNQVLQAVAKATDLSADRAAQITAEAKFLRALFHFEAKRMWNNIPYYDEQVYNSTNPNSVKISNTEDAWPKIQADFEAAIAVLPETQPGFPGRPTKYSAMAMLAKALMYQGFDVNTGAARVDKLTQAKGLLDQIIASGKYTLVEKYHDNWSADNANRNNKESIFEVQYSVTAAADGGGNAGMDLAWPYNNGPGGCCGFYQPSQNLVNAHKTENGLPLLDTFNEVDVKSDQGIASNQPFEPYTGTLDPRVDWSVGRRGIPYMDWAIHPGRDWIRDQAYGGPYSPKKHIPERRNSGIAGNQRRNANNYRMVRYAHVLLWAAECEVELGNLEKAREHVNMVRRRAANPAGFVLKADGTPAANYVISEYLLPWTDQETARKAVRFEERLEFAMEGERYFNLVRWGIAAPTLNAYLEKEKNLRTYLNNAQFIKGRHEYYPIPWSEIINTKVDGKDVLVQNPGYN
ncbi:RagB/SusD family nutrient uptake outer membrane protein [Rhodocytophaga aerolata]|uniref:RagB/SusD family nutrient uptake outer membrane protein n=1 Tax=Rhodocytophaga aerolata TaxID=455078 RepID=A0ABT8R5J7_9BACT|nr:RagB/SusD family nutrient uptake outer membrane protein [Rhodocytophaga aerolata]MDO1446037.1 RagB/SusD family nutrient uptake outer membrane protein [Rhodocytophaga aerolata]